MTTPSRNQRRRPSAWAGVTAWRAACRMFYYARRNARNKALPFDLTKEYVFDLLQATPICPVFGVPWRDCARGRGGRCPLLPSLDRIVPDRGYVRGNVAVISWRANHLKSDASLAELVDLGRWAALHTFVT